jgi:hypothetical protein
MNIVHATSLVRTQHQQQQISIMRQVSSSSAFNINKTMGLAAMNNQSIKKPEKGKPFEAPLIDEVAEDEAMLSDETSKLLLPMRRQKPLTPDEQRLREKMRDLKRRKANKDEPDPDDPLVPELPVSVPPEELLAVGMCYG